MAREHGTSDPPWGTLEELLLVCAVNRHGTKSWDSVATEVQSRSSTVVSTLLTAHNCRDKFDDLKRRFISENDTKSQSLDQMVDELRNLRVQELRLEVRRRDVSIESLEMKVKGLEEERAQGLKEKAEARPNKDRQRGGEVQPGALPEKLAGQRNSGEDSDERENRSFNESNSTSQRGEAKENGIVAKEEPVPDGNQSDPVRPAIWPEADRGCSANGKVMDDEDRVKNRKRKKGGNTVVASRLGKSNEFWESVVESKQEGKKGRVATKQNSDVQSSASLSRTKRRRGGRGGGGGGDEGGSRSRSRRSSSGEEAEGDEVSPATNNGVKLELIKHEPLGKVLRVIRSHRLGSVFERRLRSQESQRYRSEIREHMDLHAIQSSLNKGAYNDCTHKFFRDLLLLFNNAVVFFRKESSEHGAAQELRSIVLKEMAEQLSKSQPAIPTVKSNVPKIESDGSSRSRKSSIVGCGRRGSINALSESGGARNRKGVKKMEDEGDAGFVKSEDEGFRKKRTQERARGRGSMARNSSRNAAASTKNFENHEYGGNELSSHDCLEVEKLEKKENVKKKQGAARFLKRMKRNSSSNEVKKRSSEGSEGSEEDREDSMVEEKTVNRARKKPITERKERVTRSSTGRGGRRDQESSGRGRRGVGRPPKPAGAGNGKRGRDNGEADQVGSAGRPRKRPRR